VPCRLEGLESPRSNVGRSSGGLVDMQTAHNITMRTLIWLVAFSMPVQSLPAASCECDASTSFCEQAEQSKRKCCSATKGREGQPLRAVSVASCCSGSPKGSASRTTCCNADAACDCGTSCHCGEEKPPTPTPPVKDIAPEQVPFDLVSASSAVVAYLPQFSQRSANTSSLSAALTAVNRCVFLCRFTL